MNGKENWIRRIDDWDNVVTGDNWHIEIIWKPFDYGRLSYLSFIHRDNYIIKSSTLLDDLSDYFKNHPEMVQQTVLEWSDELNNLILEFLESIYSDQK